MSISAKKHNCTDVQNNQPHFRCVLLKPGVGAGKDQDASRNNHRRHTIQEFHRVGESADEVTSKHTPKLPELGQETGITNSELNSGTILNSGKKELCACRVTLQLY